MTSMTHSPHLTDDQIDDALITGGPGDLDADCVAHLAACDECQRRLTEAGAPIASFNAVSLAWGERRSATLPLRPVPSAQVAWLPRAAWAATVGAVLAVGISVPVLRHSAATSTVASRHESASPALMAATSPADNPVAVREEQIARDNQMLENIDRELSAAADSPDQEFGLLQAANHTSAQRASAPVRN